MSTPARRRRRGNVPEVAGSLAGILVAVALLALASVLIWALITAGLAAIAYLLGRLHGKPAARKPVSQFKRAGRVQAARKRPQAEADSAARRNGWLPPVNPQVTTLTLSDACAEGACHLCDGCEHKCGHDAAAIVARNEAAYDAAHDGPPPF
jgi:hypothetical protein